MTKEITDATNAGDVVKALKEAGFVSRTLPVFEKYVVWYRP